MSKYEIKQIYCREFITYIKRASTWFFLKNNSLILKKKIILIVLLDAELSLYKYHLLTIKNPFNYLQLLFLIKSNTKQYFLSFLGVTNNIFKTVSTGKILSKKGLETKSLKSSKKAEKYLIFFLNEFMLNDNNFISYCLLHPINKKNLIMLYLSFKSFQLPLTTIGFKNYYKICQKYTKRIKKRIKKKLIANFVFYS